MEAMERLVLAVVLVVVAVAVALVLERRKPSAPTQPRWEAPAQLDRADFADLEAPGALPGAQATAGPGRRPWLVAVFTSATCESCAKVLPKASVLASHDVSVVDIPYQQRKDLHERYGIDVVPLTVVAGPDGAVRASFIGVPTATDLWAAVAEARQPGSTPEPHLGS